MHQNPYQAPAEPLAERFVRNEQGGNTTFIRFFLAGVALWAIAFTTGLFADLFLARRP